MSYLARALDRLCEADGNPGNGVSEEVMIEHLKAVLPGCRDYFYHEFVSEYRQKTPKERREREEMDKFS